MKKSIFAIYHHVIKSDEVNLEEQHSLCPKGVDSWCRYHSSPSSYNENSRLASVFLDELKPIFNALTNDELLKRCLKGLTQNQNEAINGTLWAKCPKTKYAGLHKVELAVCETVGIFNTGAGCKADLLESVGITPEYNMIHAFEIEDKNRIAHAAIKSDVATRLRRRKKRGERKNKLDKVSKTTTYFPGAFGLTSEPEIVLDVPAKKRKTIRKRKINAVTDPSKQRCGTNIGHDYDVIVPTFVDDKDIKFLQVES